MAAGRCKFVKQNALLNRRQTLLTNNKLSILCEISIMPNVGQGPRNDISLLQSTLDNFGKIRKSSRYEKFLKNEKFSDVKFVVEGKDFHAHKIILSNGSEVFAAMLQHKMQENEQNPVEIEDVRYEVLTEMFRFTYSDGVIPNRRLLRSFTTRN